MIFMANTMIINTNNHDIYGSHNDNEPTTMIFMAATMITYPQNMMFVAATMITYPQNMIFLITTKVRYRKTIYMII